MEKPTSYGGQAVYEGVMMRGRKVWAVTCRTANGELVSRSETLTAPIYNNRLARLPFIRGIALLWETLNLGSRAMNFAINVAFASEKGRDPLQVQIPQERLRPSSFIGLGLGVGIFFALPVLITAWLDSIFGSGLLVSNVIEGAIRLAFLIGYIRVLGQLPDIKRVFGYHGAEHKTINAFEAGAPLTVSSVQSFGLAHPRCGTGFLMFIVVIATLVFMLLGQPDLPLRLASRLLLIPVITSLTYEFIRWGAAHYAHPLVRILLMPSIWLQGLTTRQPEDGMVEAAIISFKHVLYADNPTHPALSGYRPATNQANEAELSQLV